MDSHKAVGHRSDRPSVFRRFIRWVRRRARRGQAGQHQVTSQDSGAEDAGGQQQVTSQDSGSEDAGGQQQGGSNLPEDVWLKDIDDMYPNLQEKTYFLPPFHFNRVPFTVNVIAGLTAKVTAACCERSKKKASTSQAQGSQQPASTSQAQGSQQPASTSQAQGSQQPASTSQAQEYQQVAGTLVVPNPPNLEPEICIADYAVDDKAMVKCLRALHDISGETKMVISQLQIRNYLCNETNPDLDPRHRKTISRLRTTADLPEKEFNSECDILVIHPDHGLLVAEVKSVGSKPKHSDDHIIVKKVKIAIDQVDKLEAAFTHLLKDLEGISITKAVLLPYLTSSQLHSAVSSSESLRQKLIACTKSVDVDQAISRCLFSDDLNEPGLSAWWQHVWSVSSPLPSPQLYKRLVARFCGVASTVDIPTASLPRVVVRSLGQAVAETGLRFSALTLMHDQVELLDQHPRHQYLYLQGPPGTGKTVVLFLAALKSALQGKKVLEDRVKRQRESLINRPASSVLEDRVKGEGDSIINEPATSVVIVHMPGDVAVATLLELQLTSIVGATTAAQLIHLHTIDFGDRDLDINAVVATLRHQVGQEDNVHIIVDEAPDSGVNKFLPWVKAVRSTWPQALLWMAGLKIRDNTAPPSLRLPQWVETATLQVSLRCTPNVTDHVAKPGPSYINDITIPRYVTPPVPQHTAGPDVRELHHTPGVDGHADDDYDILGCGVCGDKVASVISELVGDKPGHGLQYRDVFVLTGYHCPAPRDDNAFVQRLQLQHDRQHVHVVEISVNDDDVVTTPPSADDVPQLVNAVDDQIIITHWRAVCGLERRAVFVLGGRGGWASDHVASTRTTSFLSYFTCHRPAHD